MLPALTFVGCTSDDEATDGGVKKPLTFIATSDGSGQSSKASERMKTQLHPDQGNAVTFSAEDAISVFDGVGNNKFTTTGAGASVTFTGVAAEAANYTALYPYQAGATMSGSTITATLPTTQTAQSMTYDPQAALSIATTTKAAMTFNFKNVCALVKLTTTEPLAKIVFKGNNGEKVAGAVSIGVSDTPTATGDAESVTLLPASPATTIAAGTYYIAVLPQTFDKGFTVEAYKTSSATTADFAFSKDFAITLTRSRILNIGEVKYTPTFDANGHDYVDLGVEVDGKKVLWATMNVGASKEWESGDYFAWGETSSKSEYTWTTYAWGTSSALTKYNATDGKPQLDLDDDAASQNWGGDWVMPTQVEWKALYDNTDTEWTTLDNVKGWKFTNKTDNTKSIFLPAAGYFMNAAVTLSGSYGFYWSSSLRTDAPSYAYILGFYPNTMQADSRFNYRHYGLSVRPVLRMAK